MIDDLGFRFHHFGLAAKVPSRAVRLLQAWGYSCEEVVHDPLQNVDLRWCTRAAAPSVEIVSAAGKNGPLSAILAAQGTSFYHLCYEIDLATASAVGRVQAEGFRIMTVREPLPAILFGGRLVSFHVIDGFGLVEFLEAGACVREGPAT